MNDISDKYEDLKKEKKARLEQELDSEQEKLQEAFLASLKEWKEKLLDAKAKDTSAKVTSLQATADAECTARETALKNTPCTAANGVLKSSYCSTANSLGTQYCNQHYECTIKVDCGDIYNKYNNLLTEHKAAQKLLTAKQIYETFDKENDLLMHNIDELKAQYHDKLTAIFYELNAEKYSEIIAESGNFWIVILRIHNYWALKKQ